MTASRPRVLFVVESGTDVRLVEGMAERFELELVCRTIPGGVAVSQSPRVSVRTYMGSSSRFFFAAEVMRRLLVRPRPDFVVVQGYALAALAANLIGRFRGLPVAMLVCSPVERYYRCRKDANDPRAPFRVAEFLALRLLARLNALLGQRYLVLSRHLADVVTGHGTRRPIDVVPVYGVDVEQFTPIDGDRTDLRRRLRLPEHGPLVLFSSRVAPEKDADTLLRAVGILKSEGRPVAVLNRSGGFEEFQRQAAVRGVGDLIDAADAVDPRGELADLYRAADLCVQASREEGLGFSPLEALSCEIPVIASAVGGLKETVIDGDTGWTYVPGDASQLARQIAAILTSPQEASRRAVNGRQLVLQRFERGRVFDQLEQIVRAGTQRREPA